MPSSILQIYNIYLVYMGSGPEFLYDVSLRLQFLICCAFRFRMFSLADASGQRTASVALRNCLYLIPLGFLAYDCELKDSQKIIVSNFFILFLFFIGKIK